MSSYRAKVERNTERANAAGRVGRDIAGEYPRRAKGCKLRRAACQPDLRRFLETYFPMAFSLGWSADHPRVIARMQTAILEGGLFALAMPRGSGKTALAVRAALWALLFKHRQFVVLIGATEGDAAGLLRAIKAELLNNELLARDFRQVTYPIRRLENNSRRCVGQLFKGKRTDIVWAADRITFPTMPDGACDGPNVSGATVAVAGMTGAIRGLFHTLPTGEVIRPDLCILDDVQTRESALSTSETNKRMETIRGDVLGLAGPGREITAFAALTVIAEGDLADQLLNRERCPEWHGERTAAVYSWPTNEELWAEYFKVRAEAQRRDEGTEAATEFYRQRREAMDAGAVVAWQERKYPNELSAVQHVMNLRQKLGESAFAAEYQNEPIRATLEADALLSAEDVAGKVNGLARGTVPLGATMLTAFVDCHDALLFYAVAAWAPNFTGWLLDYGTYPRQTRRTFTLRKAMPTLQAVFPGAGREAAILGGLNALAGELLGREWKREDGTAFRINLALVDAGYVPDTVFDFCRRSTHAAVLLASRGAGVGAASRPMSEYTVKPGERHGWYWLQAPTSNRAARYARFDANFWKSFVHGRLALAVGDRESLSLFGRDPEEHRLLAQHVTAEAPIMVTANGRTVGEWRPKPGTAENHWLDCIVGTAVAASMVGAAVEGREPTPIRGGRKQVSFRELYDKARERQGVRAQPAVSTNVPDML